MLNAVINRYHTVLSSTLALWCYFLCNVCLPLIVVAFSIVYLYILVNNRIQVWESCFKLEVLQKAHIISSFAEAENMISSLLWLAKSITAKEGSDS